MRVREDAFLVQVLRALNRKAATLVDAPSTCPQLDAYDVLSTLARLLGAAGCAASVRSGRLVPQDAAAADSWYADALSLQRPLTPNEVAAWVRHCPGVCVVAFDDVRSGAFAAGGGGGGGGPAAATAALLPLDRDGRVSRRRLCAAVVSDGARRVVIHVSDVPRAGAVACALRLHASHESVSIRNVPGKSRLSHEAALLAAVSRFCAGKRPKPKRSALAAYAAAMARARRRGTANAYTAERLRQLEESLPSRVFDALPDGLEPRHLPPARSLKLPQYTPLAARLLPAVTRVAAGSCCVDARCVLALNTQTGEWARGVCAYEPPLAQGAAAWQRGDWPLLTTLTLRERALEARPAGGLFIWLREDVARQVPTYFLPRQPHEAAVDVCLVASRACAAGRDPGAADDAADAAWVCCAA
jgi:hypothetical protein